MKVRAPTIGAGMALAGATATVFNASVYIAKGSHGEAPDMGKLSLTQSSTNASGYALNIQLTTTEALEPGRAEGEAPVRPISSEIFKLT